MRNGKAHGGWVQVSRIGNPLINEVVIPTNLKDHWNATSPSQDKQFEKYYSSPILAAVLQKLYPQFGRVSFWQPTADNTYRALLEFARTIQADLASWRPRDMIDIQSFIWVTGSSEYD